MDCVHIKINMNARVQVVLTKFGAEVYNKYINQFDRKYRDDVAEGHVLRDQLWSLFQVFGEHMQMGMREVPFEGNNIEFV